MKFILALLSPLIITFAASNAFAKSEYHLDFIKLGNTKVNVYCFSQLNGTTPDSIDLKECQKVHVDSDGLSKAEKHPDISNNGYFSPTLIGNIGDTYFINLEYSGGGTGMFDSILGVQLDADKKTLRKAVYIGGGDKADNGIDTDSIKITGNTLSYTVSLIQYGFLSIIGVDAYAISSSGIDLGNHNSSSYATATYQLTLPQTKPALVSVSDLGDAPDCHNDPKCLKELEDSPPQIGDVPDCLAGIMKKEEKDHQKLEYTPDQLHALTQKIAKECPNIKMLHNFNFDKNS